MSNLVSVNVKFDEKSIMQKIDNLIDDGTMTEIHKLFATTIDPWTPFLSGRLHTDLTITAKSVKYNAPYSSEKYYGEVYCKDNHPLATSHWDEVALQTEMDSFIHGVKDILVNRARELYG